MCSPIFPPDQQEQRRTSPVTYILVGCVGCACFAGALIVLMFVAAVLLVPEGHFEAYQEMQVGAGDSAFTLYGKTLDDEDFDWESLRGKYVLVKFTATWCPPCKMQIPGMLEAHKQYHDKGFEIVSVYIGEEEPNAVATVRRAVEQDKLPWIIISESLTAKAGQPPQGEFYGIQGVPTILLVDKEGKIIAIGTNYERELKKLFGE